MTYDFATIARSCGYVPDWPLEPPPTVEELQAEIEMEENEKANKADLKLKEK